MKNMKIALIGCGAAAKRYYLPALKKFPSVSENLYLVDKNPDLAADLSRELGGGHITADYHDIIGKVQGAIIVVPHFLHYSVAMDFLNAGVHVLCEKPLAESAHEVHSMNKAAEEHGVALCVNNTRRMFPSFRAVKETLCSGRIGRLKSLTFVEGNTFEWQSQTGFYVDPRISSKGVLFDVGAHVLDLVCWWLGKKPGLIRYQDDSFGGPESVASIEAESEGCSVNVLLNRLNVLDNRFCLVGESGTIEGQLFEWQNVEIKLPSGKTVREKTGPVVKTYPEFVVPVVGNFLNVVQGKEKPLISGCDVQDSIALIDECYENRTRFHMPRYVNVKKTLQSTERTLVTGASGFIGGRIVEMLHLTKDREVRAGIRQWSSAARLGRFPVDIAQMDLMKKNTIEKALDGVTEIIHCAKGPGGVTEEGTRNLLDIALQKGIRRFVHLSTAEVYGNVEGVVSEDAPFGYTGDEYNKTKVDAEKACWEYYAKGLPVTIMRPSIVYGPFSKNWSVRYAAMFIEGKGGIYKGFGEGKCNLVYVDDLVRAILLSLENNNAVGNAFNICGPEVVTWNEYFVKYNKMMGLPSLPVITIAGAGLKTFMLQPVRILGGLVRDHFMGPVKKIADTFDLAKAVMKQTEKTLKMTPSPGELKLFKKTAVFPADKARELLGFAPSVSLDEGLRNTVEWLMQQGFFLN